MNFQQIVKQIRDLIAKGQLEKAANALVSYFDKEMKEEDKAKVQLYNQVINQLSQLSDLKKEELSGVISQVDAGLKRNKIRMALLEITDGLKAWGQDKPLDAADTQRRLKKEDEGRGWKAMLLMLSVIAVGVLIWMFVAGPLSNGGPPKGCYIKTTLQTQLLMEPEFNGKRIGVLPKEKYYEVHEVAFYQHGKEKVYCYKIRDKKFGVGWVKGNLMVAEVSPACLRYKENLDPKPEGCYITTRLSTSLRTEADPFSGQRGELPDYKHYPVLETKFYHHGNTPIRFFKVKDDELGEGWVQAEISLDFVSAECPSSPSETEAPPPQGCYVKTDMMTELTANPAIMGQQIGRLPNKTIYPVLDTRMINHAGQKVYFFKVRDEQLGEGWIMDVYLDVISQDCYN